MAGYGRQIGVIVYGAGSNSRAFAQSFLDRGYIVVWRDRYATVHTA